MPAESLWANAQPEKSRQNYIRVKDDTSLFVGEGSAWLKDEGESPERAQAVALARARGSLAEAIEVRVQSSTVVIDEKDSNGSRESAKATAVSSTDLTLALVKTQAFENFPKNGQVTVLAWISKEEWRRQKKGKEVAVYRPENGIRLFTQMYFPTFIRNSQTSSVNEIKGWGLALVWRHFFAAFGSGSATFEVKPRNDTYEPGELMSEIAELGYEWTPWEWRVQPYFPLGFAYGNHQINNSEGPEHASTYAFFAGAGLRYWANDTLALELQARQFLPMNKANSVAFSYKSDEAPASVTFMPDLAGFEARAQVLWSAF